MLVSSLFHKKDTLEKSESMMDYNIDAILSERDHQFQLKISKMKFSNRFNIGDTAATQVLFGLQSKAEIL